MLENVAEFGGHRLNAKVFKFSAKGRGGGGGGGERGASLYRVNKIT